MMHEKARWIWISPDAGMNEYAVLEGNFCFGEGAALFCVAAETDYILRINGQLAGFGQFAGYPGEKYYDELDITALCLPGENTYTLTVRYEGVNSATINFLTQKLTLEAEDERLESILDQAEAIIRKIEPDCVLVR